MDVHHIHAVHTVITIYTSTIKSPSACQKDIIR